MGARPNAELNTHSTNTASKPTLLPEHAEVAEQQLNGRKPKALARIEACLRQSDGHTEKIAARV